MSLEPGPEATVVVPTHNRAGLLRRCLDSLDRQTAAPDAYDVVVVVDGSTDGTVELLRSLRTRFRLTVVEQRRLGPGAARNAGARRAGGHVLIFLDDDEEAGPELVAAHLEAHGGQDPVVVIGPIERLVPPGADRFARALAGHAEHNNHARASRPSIYRDVYGGNFSIPREVFERIGGFAPSLARLEDMELGYRLQAAGYRFVYVPGAVVSELRTRTWRQLLAEEERYGRSDVALYRLVPATLASTGFGGRGGRITTRRGLLVTGALAAARVPPSLLALAGLVAPTDALAQRCFAVALDGARWRGVRAADPELGRRARSGVIVLCYHAFASNGERPSKYVVPARRFARQLAWLRRRGYRVIGLDEYLEARAAHEVPPRKTVVITIDDGYRDVVTVARPLLDRFGFTATLFLISSPEAREHVRTEPMLAARETIPPGEASELLGKTFGFGAHTVNHPRLTELEPEEAEREIAESKLELERAVGRPVTAFAYPFGAYDPTVRELVVKSGFRAACVVMGGWNRPATDDFELRRIEVRGTDSLFRFALALALGELPRW